MTSRPRQTGIRCSFCGKGPKEVGRLITGPSVHICSECVEMCNDILRQNSSGASGELSYDNLPTPREVKEFLDQHIVGQYDVKRGVAVAAYNHFKRVLSRQAKRNDDDIEIEKANMLMIGPTGTGKTLVAQTLAKLLKVPFTIVDATVFTEAGYVGEDVENMLVRLLQAANHDLSKAEQGIIYVDEFDKIARKSPSPSITRDVSGEGVQQAMLKIIEGTTANIPPKGGRKHPEQNFVQINTRDILFICGGAFVGLEEIVEKRIGESRMGFSAKLREREGKTIGDVLRMVEPDDLIHYGLIPELVGRIPAVFGLDELDEDMLLNVLTQPKNALIKQYMKLFELEGVRLTFTRDALRAIVQRAMAKKTGARGLRSTLERVLVPIMFDLPSRSDVSECLVTKEVIDGHAEPVLTFSERKKSA